MCSGMELAMTLHYGSTLGRNIDGMGCIGYIRPPPVARSVRSIPPERRDSYRECVFGLL